MERVLLHSTCIAILLVSVPLPADDGVSRGVLATYTAGDETVRRVDQNVSFVWQAASPDERLPAGPFSAEWSAQLLIRDETRYTFHAYVEGRVDVQVDGASVLRGETAEPGWLSGPAVEIGFGFRDLDVRYERTGDAGRLHLFWSSDRFPLEPLPVHLLFHDEAEPDLERIEQGRVLFAAHRCGRCHRRESEPLSPPGPDLSFVATGLNPQWLIDKLRHEHPGAVHAKMPDYGFTADDARAIAAFLWSASGRAELSQPPEIETPDDSEDSDEHEPPAPDGEELARSVGCLACHRIGEFGEPGPFGGGDLTAVGDRRSRDWLYTKLTEPAVLGDEFRMPHFDLSDQERARLAAMLSQLGHDDDTAFSGDWPPAQDEELVEQGRRLFAAARCAACHRLQGFEPTDWDLSSLQQPIADWSRTCLAEEPDRERLRPAFPQADRDALRAYVESRQGARSAQSEFARGRELLQQRNCLQCHERGTSTGLVAAAGRVAARDPHFTGQSQALIPPNLTAVGDKLRDEMLEKAVSGRQPRRMPWLYVQMPRYEHSEEDRDALLAYLIGHDRIPPGAPGDDLLTAADSATAETLVAGQTLVGAGGFSCIACHEMGDYVPPNVAIATHGSDLLGLSDRMRPEFFLRWTRSPLRIIPGIEMPSYERPVPGILDEDVDRQLAAVWEAVNDPRFTTPTNPTAVEQLWIVTRGERPRIVRDVFTVSEANGGGYVPRAFAAGFDNGHSLLLDLDTGAVRGWTIGEFARQQTQGKSWFWELAGSDAATGFDGRGGLFVSPDAFLPSDETGPRRLKLRSYRVNDDELLLTYVYDPTDDAAAAIDVEERWRAISEENRWGVRRRITAEPSPDRTLLLALPSIEPHLGDAQLAVQTANAETVEFGDGLRGIVFAAAEHDAQQTLTLDYVASVRPAPPQPIPPPEVERQPTPVTAAPGFEGSRLALPASIMPTSLAFRDDGALVFTSLKGHVYLARDSDGDGLEDELTVFEEGLAAPFGVLPDGDDLLIAHKPELLRLRDTDGDGRCDERVVVADGWGLTFDYHDWTIGPVRDAEGRLYVATGNDYTDRDRPESTRRWRGKVLRIQPGEAPPADVHPFAHELRYPIGLAIDAQGRMFASDQQGEVNTFNEINHIVPGGRYGFKALEDDPDRSGERSPAVQVPHPWTRSVNGLFFLPPPEDPRVPRAAGNPLRAFAGQGVGCEYNSRFLIRFTLQEVDGELQGATYEFTRPDWEQEADTFLGPICGAVGPAGDVYIGSMHDSGWLGGRNTGEIVRLRPTTGSLPNGIREARAIPGGFELEFLRPVDAESAGDVDHYAISGYTRVWQGSYATPDSERYAPRIRSASLADDGRSVTLAVDDLREGFVYEISCGDVPSADGTDLWPSTAHYTLNRIPR